MSTTIISRTIGRGRATRLRDWMRNSSFWIGVGRRSSWASIHPLGADTPADYPYDGDGTDSFFDLQVIKRASRVVPAYPLPAGVLGEVNGDEGGWNLLNYTVDIDTLMDTGASALYVEGVVTNLDIADTYRVAAVFTDPVIEKGRDSYSIDEINHPGIIQDPLLYLSPITHSSNTQTRFRFILPL